MKRIIGVVIALGVIGSITLLLFRTATKQTAPLPAIVRVAPTTAIAQPSKVSFSFQTAPALPTKLPVYEFSFFSPQEFLDFGKNLVAAYDLSATTSTLIRNGITTKSWTRTGAALTATVADDMFSYVFHQTAAHSKPQNPAAPTETAIAFVSSLFTVPSPIVVAQKQLLDGPFDGLVYSDQFAAGSVTGVVLSYSLSGIPLATLTAGDVSGSVIVDNLGIIRSATLFPPPKAVVEKGSVPILSKEDIIHNLEAGRGSVISAGQSDAANVEEQLSFTSFTITGSHIVYAASDSAYMPAILLSGSGVGSRGSPQEATFFLWATPL